MLGMLIYRWWNLAGGRVGRAVWRKATVSLFLCHCLEDGVYCICTKAFSLLQLNKGFEKSSPTKGNLNLVPHLLLLLPWPPSPDDSDSLSQIVPGQRQALKNKILHQQKTKGLFLKPS